MRLKQSKSSVFDSKALQTDHLISDVNIPSISSGLPSPLANSSLSSRRSYTNADILPPITIQKRDAKSRLNAIVANKTETASPYAYTHSAKDDYEEQMLLRNLDNKIDPETRISDLNDQKYDIDEKMGDPYIKLKIENLWNFKKEPLENYDLERLHEEDPTRIINTPAGSRGMSKFVNQSGTVVWKACEVLDYNEETGLYLIRWRDTGITKEVMTSMLSRANSFTLLSTD